MMRLALQAVEALAEACISEGCAADRATSWLEAPARRGHWGSGTFKECQSLVGGIP